MRISDWSSDVCSSDLDGKIAAVAGYPGGAHRRLRPIELRLGLRTRRPGGFEVLTRRDLRIEQPLFARRGGSRRLCLRRRRIALGDECRRLPTLEQRDGLAGADRIAKALVDANHGAVGP